MRHVLHLLLSATCCAFVAPLHAGTGLECTEAHLKPDEQATCLAMRRGRLERELDALLSGLRQSIERDTFVVAGDRPAYLAAVNDAQSGWEKSAATTCALVDYAWAGASGGGRDLARLRCEVESLRARIAELERVTGARPIKSMLDVPVEVSYRNALLGPGLVVSLANLSDESLTVKVTMLRGSSGAKTVQDFTLPASSRTEVGHAEGLAFAAGDEVLVEHAEYRPVRARLRD